MDAEILREVEAELRRARTKFPGRFASAHEGYAVLAEEVDELWEHVKRRREARNREEMRAEAIQCAAMAVRFAADICGDRSGDAS
jgi:NTP pyrophosphatase (non-canonical NTP hydrolase)